MQKYAKVAPLSPLKNQENAIDDNKSDASSSINSEHQAEIETEEQMESKFSQRQARQSKFIEKRNKLRDDILKDVMSAVLPDEGAYDLDGMVKAKARTKDSQLTKFLKFLGLIDLDLHEAVLSGYDGKVRRSVAKIMKGKNANPALINQYNGEGRTPLIIACMLANSKIVTILLRNSALVDICEESTGRTPLMYAVINRNIEISQALVEAKATVDMADFKCITPLMLACSKKDTRHVKYLISRYADVDLQDENGWTALHYSVQANAFDCVRILLDEGADRSIKDVNRRKPLDFAKFLDYGECIALLSAAAKVAL